MKMNLENIHGMCGINLEEIVEDVMNNLSDIDKGYLISDKQPEKRDIELDIRFQIADECINRLKKYIGQNIAPIGLMMIKNELEEDYKATEMRKIHDIMAEICFAIDERKCDDYDFTELDEMIVARCRQYNLQAIDYRTTKGLAELRRCALNMIYNDEINIEI